jgi:hypothetical protein
MNNNCCYSLEDSVTKKHSECFQLLHSYNKDFKITADLVTLIADTGNLQIMEYLYSVDKSDIKFNNYITAICCINNDIDILKFVVKNGCPVNEWALIFAILESSNKCLKYAIDNNFVYNKTALLLLLNKNNKDEINSRYPEFENKKEYDWRKKYTNLLMKIELFRWNK